MDWKNFLRPTKGKIITSLVITALAYFFTSFFGKKLCKMCAELKYERFPDIISTCNCTVGQTFPQFLSEVFIVFILPFIITYLIHSTISTLINKNKQ